MKYKLIGLFIFFGACSTISKFDQYSYTQAVSIKVDALNIMQTATAPFSKYEKQVNELGIAINKIYEYETNRSENQTTAKMWALMRDTTGHLYGGFISRWQKEGSLDKTFILESSKLVSESFDHIAQLESGKIKPSQITN